VTRTLSPLPVASAWIKRRQTEAGKARYRVEYRLGGRESAVRYAGSFKTMREALARKSYVAGELAAQHVPEVGRLVEPAKAPTVGEAAARWQESRVDISENTRLQHRSSVRLLPATLRALHIDAITPQDVADAVAELHDSGKKRETIRKALTVLAMTLDHAGVTPNPARNKIAVKLPREARVEPSPPTAEHVIAVYHLLPRRHRLALLWLDCSGARVGSIDETLISDYDEQRRRVRLRAAVSKAGRGLWVDLPEVLAEAIEQTIGPREDSNPDARIFAESGADALRTAIGKACRPAGVPTFSPRRPTAPTSLTASHAWRSVGPHRRARGAARPRSDGEHLHARADGRIGARLLHSARMSTRGAVLRVVPAVRNMPICRLLRYLPGAYRALSPCTKPHCSMGQVCRRVAYERLADAARAAHWLGDPERPAAAVRSCYWVPGSAKPGEPGEPLSMEHILTALEQLRQAS
jgi:hypothetical protein